MISGCGSVWTLLICKLENVPMRDSMKVEGYWRRAKAEDESGLPFPVAKKTAWKGKKQFLVALAEKEQNAEEVAYRGLSSCRICRKLNGHIEFELNGWRWPAGFRHYVEKHNVRPSDAFIEFVFQK